VGWYTLDAAAIVHRRSGKFVLEASANGV